MSEKNSVEGTTEIKLDDYRRFENLKVILVKGKLMPRRDFYTNFMTK